MFLYRSRVKGRDYVQICRSERLEGRTKRRYVAALGSVPTALEEVTRALNGEEPVKDILRQVERTRLLEWKTRLENWLAPGVTNSAGFPVQSNTNISHLLEREGSGKHVSPDILMYWLQVSQSSLGRASKRAPVRIRMFEHDYPIGRWIETANRVRVEYTCNKPYLDIDGHEYPIHVVLVVTNLREKPYFVRFSVVCADGTRIEIIRRSKFKKDLAPEVKRWKLDNA
ncbi:hypothetical protein [Alicyclobacillus macrosporangiidus]|uniref:Uncharacterized protein n=1 Tax=Alicyclobacillus macrosporangiidus TaxID=392015 RepID=A0A1I7KCD7_9BACL|nr:hypothetical protein [Alicyclobacillus macrosporangiidus]SFU95065.1 hypothetical protein SAMN05421543_11524 [Alicyclobacillus macrosporangiidus]